MILNQNWKMIYINPCLYPDISSVAILKSCSRYCFISCNVTVLHAAQKMKFSSKNFFSKCGQIRRKLRLWSHLLKKSLMENFIFCAVTQCRPQYPANFYMFKINNGNTRKSCEICSKLTIKTPERRRRSGAFIINFEHILHIFLVFLLLL